MIIKVGVAEIKDLLNKVLLKQGYMEKEAEVIAKVILFGALRESSQGLNKLFSWHANKTKGAKVPQILRVTGSVAKCDASRNSGMYANVLATEYLIQELKENGIFVVGVTNFNSSSGQLCYYTKAIAQAGYVGIMFASADPVGGIAPMGRKLGVFGTNPLSISVPYKGRDLTLDMSTAKYTWGELVKADIEGRSLEPGFAYDKDGEPTQDPKEAMNGSVSAFDGTYKGIGLAFMIQIIAGGLVGSVYEQSDELCDYGSLIVGIDPQNLGGLEFMEAQISKIVSAYKNGKGGEVFLPGERGDLRYLTNVKNGTISIDSELYNRIKAESTKVP